MSTLKESPLTSDRASALMQDIANQLTTMRLVCNGEISARYLFDNPGEVSELRDADRSLRQIEDALDIACRRDIEPSGIFNTGANRVLIEISRDGFLRIEGIGITGEKTGAKRRLAYHVAYSDELTPMNWRVMNSGYVANGSICNVVQPQSCPIEGYSWLSVAHRGPVREGLIAHAKSLQPDIVSPAMIAAHQARSAASSMRFKVRGVLVCIDNMINLTREFSAAIDPFLGEADAFAETFV